MLGVSLETFVLFSAGGVVTAVLLLRSRRLVTGGLGFFERRRMRREGTPAQARVLDAVPCNLGFPRDDRSSDHRVVLEIYDDEGNPKDRVQLSLRWRGGAWGSMVQGRRLPVLVSPSFPGRAMIDLPAMRRDLRQQRERKRAADEDRQRSLLDR